MISGRISKNHFERLVPFRWFEFPFPIIRSECAKFAQSREQ